MPERSASHAASSGENLLFLTDEQLRRGIEAMFFAYRGFTADPDRILENYAYGRAHHRAIHFINRSPGTTVNNLLTILGVTKQSLEPGLAHIGRGWAGRKPGGHEGQTRTSPLPDRERNRA